ncbi:MAG: zinc ribbon domain-containing protein, partial [Bacteroidaceae bacterium]|nr:zinc ribbon domain-containing protein [Bacteroidaceae bacterium]
MYMGYWDKAEGKPKRFPNRDTEKDFYARFLAKEKGYYDDEKWWEVVEQASCPPVEPLLTCEVCGSQNLAEAEVCSVCGTVLKGKECINPECGEIIPVSATTCPKCGQSQIPKVESPWVCEICGTKNPAGTTVCRKCGQEEGTQNPLEEEELITHSIKDDELSVPDVSVTLANGSKSNPLNFTIYHSRNVIASPITGKRFPLISYKKPNVLTVVVDDTHPIFRTCGTNIIELLASEIAAYIFDVHRTLASDPAHSISNLTWQIIEKYWLDK